MVRPKLSPAAKVAFFYCTASVAWIVGSDRLAGAAFGADVAQLQSVQTLKGLLFVLIMAVALYWLVTQLHQLERQKRQMEAMLRVSTRLETVGTLAATLVHDLNNMLAVIRGFTDLAKLEQAQAGALPSRRLADIDSAVTRANAMVRQLSLFLQRAPGAAAPVDPAAMLREMEPLLRQAATRRVAFKLEIEAGLPVVPLDRGALEQGLLNLVVNARDAMEAAPPRELTVRLDRARLQRHVSLFHPKPVSGEFLRISVKDTGCGIPGDRLVAVFDPFFTTKPAGAGTGLGLASVLRTAQQHGGWVEVESEPGRGARFDVYLPVRGVANAGGRA